MTKYKILVKGTNPKCPQCDYNIREELFEMVEDIQYEEELLKLGWLGCFLSGKSYVFPVFKKQSFNPKRFECLDCGCVFEAVIDKVDSAHSLPANRKVRK